MFRKSLLCFGKAAAGASAAAGSSSSSSSASSGSASAQEEMTLPPMADRVQTLCDYVRSQGAHYEGVRVAPTESHCHGLYADCVFREGTTVMCIPMQALALSADGLRQTSPSLAKYTSIPSLDDVVRLMTARSIQDPVLFDQFYFALLLAAEHLNVNSAMSAYFDVLPHPAIDDEAVIGRYKDVLDPPSFMEWDDYQREFLAILHILLTRWSASEAEMAGKAGKPTPVVPPVELAYWALRTVLGRAHLLPRGGTSPQEVGSQLHYSAIPTVNHAEQSSSWTQSLKATLRAFTTNSLEADTYRLVPTLVPVLDMAGHVSSTNVMVNVQTRPEVGSCVELQAIRQIDKGEAIGMRYNTKQSPAFLLYRFGFIPQ